MNESRQSPGEIEAERRIMKRLTDKGMHPLFAAHFAVHCKELFA